jgi:hypothetical protein
LLNGVLFYAKDELYRTDEVLGHIRRDAYLMSKLDQPFPIDFLNLNYANYKRHMNWYKDTNYDKLTGENFYGIKHRKDCISCFLLAYGYNPKIWHFKLPHRPKRKNRHIPPPDIVHNIINYNFFPGDKDRTSLFQYIHAHSFWIGPRPPSELCLLTNDSFNCDEGYINAVEKKYTIQLEQYIQKNQF